MKTARIAKIQDFESSESAQWTIQLLFTIIVSHQTLETVTSNIRDMHSDISNPDIRVDAYEWYELYMTNPSVCPRKTKMTRSFKDPA
jgi:hypothetical protein